jgi:predicted permease
MRWLRKSRLRLQSLFHRSRLERDLDDELRDYVEREIEIQIARGASFEEARRRALLSLSGAERVREECRDARGVRWFEDALSDLRFAFRTLHKTPAFAITVIAALAFCIGLNAAIFSVVDTVLFRPLLFPDQDRLVSLTEGVPALGYPVMPFSCPDYLFVAANGQSFASTGTYRTQEYEIAGAGQPRRIEGARLSASMFQVLGIPPAMGRAFTQREDDRSTRVAVLNDGFARSLFGTPQQALGRTILLNRIPYEVIGIMPRSFSFPIRGSRFNDQPAELFVPVSWSNEERQQTVSDFDYSMIARLRPNVTVQQANAEVRGLIKRLAANYPTRIKQMLQHLPNFSLESQVIPFREEFTGNVQRPLLLLLAAVGIVLLIGCSDVANLMFSRMVGRQREFALRTALGAGFGRLARQTLTEGLLLSAIGGAIGFGVAFWAIPLLVHLAPDTLPRLNEVGLNWRITVFVVAITLATPLFFCLAPFVGAIRSGLADQLRGEGRTSTQGKRERRIMSAAVIFQFSLAFLLLTTAGLLLRSFLNASAANPGFQAEHLLSMRIALPDTTYKTPAQIRNLFNRLLARLSTLPGVRQVGAISDLPMDSTTNVLLSIEGRGTESERADTLFCLGDVLGSLRLSLLKGRMLEPEDYIGKLHAAVISEGLARRAWPHENPIGRHIKFGVDDPMNDQSWLTVVGVVADVKARLTSQSPRLAVFTTPPDWVNTMNVLVRTPSNPLSLASAIRHEVNQIDPNLPTGSIKTVDQILDESLSAERFRTWLLASFAIAAMLLATLGIAGLLAYNAAQRMQEFGVRVALGANRGNLLGLVLRHCLRLSSAGVIIGLVASLVVTRTLSALLYDTSPFDPVTFVAVSAILMLVALGAAMIPAWRVIHVDAATSLRAD